MHLARRWSQAENGQTEGSESSRPKYARDAKEADSHHHPIFAAGQCAGVRHQLPRFGLEQTEESTLILQLPTSDRDFPASEDLSGYHLEI